MVLSQLLHRDEKILNVGFVHSPPIADAILLSPEDSFQLRRVMKDPAIDSAMINGKSTFLHHFFNISITEGVCQIPTNALEDHVVLKMPAFEGYGCHGGLPENGLRLTHPAICDRTRNLEFFRIDVLMQDLPLISSLNSHVA